MLKAPALAAACAVMREAEAVSRRLQRTRPDSTATIEALEP